MRGLIVASIIILIAACSQQSPASVATPGDAEMRQLLVGPWHPARDSDDYGAQQEEDFSADGTYTSTTYRNARCTAVDSSGNYKWSIKDGILFTSAASTTEPPDRDQILVLDTNHLKTRGADSQQIYSRDRGYLCAARAAPVAPSQPHQTDDKGDKPPPAPNQRPKPKFGP